MKQVTLNMKSGEVAVEEVPEPVLRSGGVLVRNEFSLISAGTEASAKTLASQSLVQKARSRPDLVKKVVDKARRDGVATAFRSAMARLEAPAAPGYSCAGVVIAVADDVHDMAVGDRVACAGAGYASHAEVVFAPRNLVAKIPDGVATRDACAATVGAIAMHGVRQADAKLGETVAVIGLGLVGLITVQILRAAGIHVIGIDLDASRCDIAKEFGAEIVSGSEIPAKIAARTDLGGVDAAIITAATASNGPMELAAEICRDRGTVVAVGAVGMDVPRRPFYDKELDLKLSRSYGPGRYDPLYEEGGIDYPAGYVRWTENRNMMAFLDLVAQGKLRMEPLVQRTYPIAAAADAYQALDEAPRPIGSLFEYPHDESEAPRRIAIGGDVGTGDVAIGIVGAGGFATSTLVPAMKSTDAVSLRAVCSGGGLSAKAAGKRFGVEYVCSDIQEMLDDENISAVAIATRNSTHAAYAIRALEAGKHVFVEKPPALNEHELEAICAAQKQSGCHVQVGYNRRYAPFIQELQPRLAQRRGPVSIHYEVHAEQIPADHWLYQESEGGSRIISEVGHFIDLMGHLVGEAPRDVYAVCMDADEGRPSRENMRAVFSWADGSIGTLGYCNRGGPSFEKERITTSWDGNSATVRDFRVMEIIPAKGRRIKRKLARQDKGHAAQFDAFAGYCHGNGPEWAWVSRATFALRESLLSRAAVPIQ